MFTSLLKGRGRKLQHQAAARKNNRVPRRSRRSRHVVFEPLEDRLCLTASFSSPTDFAVGNGPNLMDVADYDADGDLDLAVVNHVSNSFSVLLGSGTGSFGAATEFSMTGAGPGRIVNADFNNDGKLDLAVVHPTSNSGGFGNTVSVHLGDGTGAFASPGTSFTTGGSNSTNGGLLV